MRIEQDFQPIGKGNPLAIYFVYPKIGNPFIVKGHPDKVQEFITSFSCYTPCFYRYTFWGKSKSRGSWKSASNKWWILKRPGKKRGYEVSGVKTDKTLYLRRIPNKWIKEFDMFV